MVEMNRRFRYNIAAEDDFFKIMKHVYDMNAQAQLEPLSPRHAMDNFLLEAFISELS